MGSGFSKRKKEAKALQSQFSQMQSQMEKTEVVGSAGNGLVTVTINGSHEIKQLKIKPECVDPEDIEGLEDLIKAAFADANKKLSNAEGSMPGMPAGMPDLKSLGLF
jgi:DNA-binding YbaB/EbfC family protein